MFYLQISAEENIVHQDTEPQAVDLRAAEDIQQDETVCEKTAEDFTREESTELDVSADKPRVMVQAQARTEEHEV